MTRRRIYLALSLGLMSACSTHYPGSGTGSSTAGSTSGDAALSGERWHAIEIDGRPAATFGPSQVPWVSFESGRVTGFAGCNQFNGPYTRKGSTLTFGALAMTRMACSDQAANAQESAFAAALHDTDHYVISADTLTLLRANTRRARLVR